MQIVYEDKRTPLKARLLIWLTLGYLFSAIDLIPDFIPVLGLLDDIVIVPLLITLVIKLIPKESLKMQLNWWKVSPQQNGNKIGS